MNITNNSIFLSQNYTPPQDQNKIHYIYAILLSFIIILLHYNIKSYMCNYSSNNNNNTNKYTNNNTNNNTNENNNDDSSDSEYQGEYGSNINSSFSLHSTEPKKRSKKKQKTDNKKDITITIHHTEKENCTIAHVININNTGFTKWIENFKLYNFNSIVNLIREGSVDTPIQLFREIRNSQLFSNSNVDWKSTHPKHYNFNKKANIIIKEFFNNNLIVFDEIKSSLLNVNENAFYFLEDSSEEEYFEDLPTIEVEDEDEDDEIEESFENFYEDVQYIPKDKLGNSFIFTQKQKDDINFMKKNIFPTKFLDQGPSFNLPEYCNGNMDIQSVRNDIIDYVFDKFFDNFLKTLLLSTNDYLAHVKRASVLKRMNAPWFCKYSEFTITDLKNYFAIFIFVGLNRLTNIGSFWEKPNNYNGLSFYNSSISNIMSYEKYKAIHRCVHFQGFGTDDKPTDLSLLYEFINSLIKSLYKPGGEFSFDDDLYKWTGKGGLKKRIPGKADRVGNILWKLVDSNTYIYHFEIEHLVDKTIKKDKINTPIGEEILNRTIGKLKEIDLIKDRPFTCMIIDAGLLGSIENKNTLSKNGYYYIISVASNRNGNIFQQFIDHKKRKTNFEIGEIKYGQNGQCTAIAWQCKKDKTFYVLTNIPEPILKEKEEELKRESNTKAKKGEYEKKFLTTPRVIWLYNNCHNYVDSSKMVINPQRNDHRARTYQRVVFNDCFYILLYNCWVVVNLFLSPNTQPLLFREFLLHLCNNQFISGSIIQRISRNAISVPVLNSDKVDEQNATCVTTIHILYKIYIQIITVQLIPNASVTTFTYTLTVI